MRVRGKLVVAWAGSENRFDENGPHENRTEDENRYANLRGKRVNWLLPGPAQKIDSTRIGTRIEPGTRIGARTCVLKVSCAPK